MAIHLSSSPTAASTCTAGIAYSITSKRQPALSDLLGNSEGAPAAVRATLRRLCAWGGY